jgi:hypothetical protein
MTAMDTSTSSKITTALAAKAARGAAVAFAACGVVQLVHSQHTGTKVVGLAGHLNLGFFIVALLCLAPVFGVLAGYASGTVAPKAARVAAAGTTVLGVTCITSLVMGHDGPWFVVVAPITNAAWLFSSIAIAVGLKRAGRLPAWLAIGLPLSWIVALPLSNFGGGLVAGAYWLFVAVALSGEGEARPAAQPAFATGR